MPQCLRPSHDVWTDVLVRRAPPENGTLHASSSMKEGLSMIKTAAVMTKNVVVVSPIVSTGGAASMMERLAIRHLPVVDAGRLIGILSDRDLLKHGRGVPCGEAMTVAPVTCSADVPVGRVAQLMLDHKIDSIPIVGASGALVGLVTSTDLLWLLVEHGQEQLLPFDFQVRLAGSDGEALAVAA
jgi:acetoin utilization protein AcuB